MPLVYLSRKESFSAAHRLHSPALTDVENVKVYGKCNNVNGHGHNYIVEGVVCGELDEKTGMVYNLSDLKEHMKNIVEQLDHKNLDKDVEYFKTHISTTENVAIFIYDELVRRLPVNILYEVIIHETDKNVIRYRGE